jgi:hypothetical protein
MGYVTSSAFWTRNNVDGDDRSLILSKLNYTVIWLEGLKKDANNRAQGWNADLPNT